jgi:hypothetical protein
MLIIPNIPIETTYNDIRNFLSPALKGFWPFVKKGKIEKVKILIYKDTSNNDKIEHHALVTVISESVGTRIIKKLNRKRLLDKPVNIRPYEIRSWQNDRRHNHSIIKDKNDEGNRRSDRRRGKALEEITDVNPIFTGLKEYAKKI